MEFLTPKLVVWGLTVIYVIGAFIIAHEVKPKFLDEPAELLAVFDCLLLMFGVYTGVLTGWPLAFAMMVPGFHLWGSSRYGDIKGKFFTITRTQKPESKGD